MRYNFPIVYGPNCLLRSAKRNGSSICSFEPYQFVYIGHDWRQKWVAGARHGNSLVVRQVSQDNSCVILNKTRCSSYGILKLIISRGQRNLCTVIICVSCEENGCYRIVSLGHQNFGSLSYCGLSRRMQGTFCTSTRSSARANYAIIVRSTRRFFTQLLFHDPISI